MRREQEERSLDKHVISLVFNSEGNSHMTLLRPTRKMAGGRFGLAELEIQKGSHAVSLLDSSSAVNKKTKQNKTFKAGKPQM